MREYVERRRTPLRRVVLFIGLTTLAAIASGVAGSILTKGTELVFPIPLATVVLLAFSVGAYVVILDRMWIAERGIAIAVAIWAGCVVLGAHQYAEYRADRNETIAKLASETGASREAVGEAFDASLLEQTGAAGFVGYLKATAELGQRVETELSVGGTPVLPSGSFTVRGGWLWLSRLAELAIVVTALAWVGSIVRPRMECTRCKTRLGVGTQVGVASVERLDALVGAIDREDWSAARALIDTDTDVPHPTLEVHHQRCRCPDSRNLVTVRRTGYNQKHEVTREMCRRLFLADAEWAALSPCPQRSTGDDSRA